MTAIIRILFGAIYGCLCYAVLLWLVATAAPHLGLSGSNMEAALYWPANIFLYSPRMWAQTPTEQTLLTVSGAFLILRGMVSAARKIRRERLAAASIRSSRLS